MFYIRTADRLQRTAPWLERSRAVSSTCARSSATTPSVSAADLDATMATHVAGYRDEWAAVLDDPEKLSRFVSFVNAPDVPDPTVAFDESGDRKVPVLLGMPDLP